MKAMKNLVKTILMMAVLPIMALSCTPVEEVHQPGEPDLENCYGVYFPTQEASGSHALDPSDPKSVEFVVKRLNKEDEISVPVEVTASEDGIFEVSELYFAAGNPESKITVTFDNAQQGVDYELTLEIKDPEYASIYSENPVSINYSVIIERYDLIGKALYREDLLTALFNVPNVEWEVEVYTKETKPGVYYLKNVYQPGVCPLFAATDESGNPLPVETTYMEIDASNPAKVLFPFQYLGLVIDPSYGECAAGSLAPEAGFNVAEGVYGTLSNMIIEFPADGLLFGMSLYNDFGFYYANGSGMFRVALPGAVLTDYTIKLAAGLTNQGKLPVQFAFGADVASIKYMVFEGALNAAGIAEKVREVKKNESALVINKPEPDAEGNVPPVTVALTLPATGEYTVVAVGYDDAGEAQSDASLAVTYVADGDSVPVVVNAGLASTDKYVPLGFSPETSVEYYLYGEDLTDVKIGLFSTVDLQDVQACIAAVLESPSADAETLAAINDEVYVDVIKGLTPGTEYRMIVYASNGYEETAILTDPITTAGEPSPVYASYTLEDIDMDLLPTSSEGYFGTYNYYVRDMDENGNIVPMRHHVGQITLSDSEYPDSDPDSYGVVSEYVTVTGLVPYAKQAGMNETTTFEYYDGVLYTLSDQLGMYAQRYYTQLMAMDPDTGRLYNASVLGGFVADGYIAFVNAYASQGVNITGLYLAAFSDEACTDYLGGLDAFVDILLVDPEVDVDAPSSAAQSAMSVSDLNKLQFNLGSEINYVETERGRIHSIIDRMHAEKKAPKMAGCNAGIKGVWDAPSVEFSVEEVSSQFQPKADFNNKRNAQPVLYR